MLKNPKNYSSFINGVTQYQNQKYNKAAQCFMSSLTLQSDYDHQLMSKRQKSNPFYGSYEVLLNLSCCFIKQKQFRKAQDLCYRALQFKPYDSVPYYNLSTIEIRKQNYVSALHDIKCALSCEYLRKYERVYEKKYLDLAIYYASNNLSAIKYRISVNSNMLRLLKHLSIQHDQFQSQVSIRQQQIIYENQQAKHEIMNQLEHDIKTLQTYNRIYEIQFNKANHESQKQNKPNNFFITKINPQFILQSKQHKQPNKTKLQDQLQVLKQLKHYREQYLKLIKQNQTNINIQHIINIDIDQQIASRLLKYNQQFVHQINGKTQSKLTQDHQNTIETSFQLQDSYKTHQQSENQDIQHYPQVKYPIFNKNNKINIKNSNKKQKTTLNNPKKSIINKNKQKNLTFSNLNKQVTKKKLKQNQCLATSIISIKDYQQQNNLKQLQQEETPQYNVNLIHSVIVPNTSHNQSSQLFQIQQQAKFYKFSQMKNKSTESLINNLLSPTKDLKHSQYQFDSRLSQSKSYLKILSCSKCSIDHDNQNHGQKNVNLQINLAEIYNYECNFSELQTFCVVKHGGQQLKTQISKGKFPNWKQKIEFHVDFDCLNQQNHDNCGSDQECNQSKKIKIQLWAKSTHFKKDSALHPNDLIQLIGQQQINLRQQKWTNKKIILQNKASRQKKKTAYMYVCLQKIKPKKY